MTDADANPTAAIRAADIRRLLSAILTTAPIEQPPDALTFEGREYDAFQAGQQRMLWTIAHELRAWDVLAKVDKLQAVVDAITTELDKFTEAPDIDEDDPPSYMNDGVWYEGEYYGKWQLAQRLKKALDKQAAVR